MENASWLLFIVVAVLNDDQACHKDMQLQVLLDDDVLT